ncbi:MAG: hypothetical protein IKN63_05345 [Bacilli bacterium]|nr:hypothetical protein [Bacilli bacterium]
MKDKIILFVIGVLLGAVIATGAFYIYTTTAKSCDYSSNNTQMNGGQPPEMPSGQNSENGQPPEKPSDSKTQDSNQNNNN